MKRTITVSEKTQIICVVSCLFSILYSCNVDQIEQTFDFELYKYDTLWLPQSINQRNIDYDPEVWSSTTNGLVLITPDEIVDRIHAITIDGEKRSVRIKDWKDNIYGLESAAWDGKYPLYHKSDTSFFIWNDQLMFQTNNRMSICCNFHLEDKMYNQMIAEYGWYAIRSGQSIYISNDLRNWLKIYSDKRAISKSMAFVINKGELELIFSEYTPGSERLVHHVYKYNIKSSKMRSVIAFYPSGSNQTPIARHIHILEKDPYSGDIWLGTGDTDQESHVYRSTDNGESFELVGSGSQLWRILSFIFTNQSVSWNVDSHAPQYITQLKRTDLKVGEIASKLKRYSIINSACWSTLSIKTSDGRDMYVMSSNNEGGLYDNYCRTYGIIIEGDKPVIYELAKINAYTQYTQLFPIGVLSHTDFVLYNHEQDQYKTYKIVRK